jgi:lysozyme
VGCGHLIGDGHSLPDSWNRVFTLKEIDALLAKDVARFERGVSLYCSVYLTQSQFDALVSFSFNLGLGVLQRSRLRQKLNRGDKKGAVQSLLKYNKANGIVLKGLDLRRKAEAALFRN